MYTVTAELTHEQAELMRATMGISYHVFANIATSLTELLQVNNRSTKQ